jgi:hypothetical protein
MRYVAAVGSVVLGLVMTASAEAQSAFERVWIDVNVGVAVAADDAFSMDVTRRLFAEPADFGADYSLPRGASFDVGGGFMITPVFGVGVSLMGQAHEEEAILSARIPHPTFGNVYASDDALTDDVMQRSEGSVNLQAMIVAAQTDRFRFRVFGGPTYFRIEQDAITNIRFNQVFRNQPPSNSIEITEFDFERIEGNAWGFHAGADASVFFNRIIGVGGFAKFSRASLDLEDTLATAVGEDDVVSVKAGGFQVGGGLRLKF